MPFYLRKSYRFGPLRFNLSKSGVGLSAGVTGARLGVNKRGAYVHGGRHGLYFRKHISSKSGSNIMGPDATQDIFMDTGLTYQGLELPEISAPAIPSPRYTALKAIIFIVAVVAIFGGTLGGQMLGAALITGLFINRINIKRAQKAIHKLQGKLEDEQLKTLFPGLISKAPWYGAPRRWFEEQAALLLLEAGYGEEHPLTLSHASEIQQELRISQEDWSRITRTFFITILEEALADQELTKEEEDALNSIAEELAIPDEDLCKEKKLIELLSDIRNYGAEEAQKKDFAISLKRDEYGIFVSKGRLLKENVQERFQKKGITYRKLGYVTDLEGNIYITNKRIIIESAGLRSYQLARIKDITLVLRDYTVHIKLEDRKNPLIFTLPDAPYFAAALEKNLQKRNITN